MEEKFDLNFDKLSSYDNRKGKSNVSDQNLFKVIVPLQDGKKDVEKIEKNNERVVICAHCNKKTGLVNYKCRCLNFYCSKHRESFSHKCDFDYRKHNQDKLKLSLQKIEAEKINKI